MITFFLLIFYVFLGVFIYEYYILILCIFHKTHHEDHFEIMNHHLPLTSS